MTTKPTYLLYDGVIFASDAPILKTTNRGFRFADGIFETIHYHRGQLLFFADHYQRLIRGLAVLKFSLAGFPSRKEFEERTVSLINKNRFFGDVRVRITVFRKGEGLYTPTELQASWIIETTPLEQTGYNLNEKGLVVDRFQEFPKLPSPVSPFKTIASQPYIMAGLFCKENNLDDVLLTNGQGKIIESISANLFYLKNDKLFTPGIGSGCIEGVFRKQILELAPTLGFRVVETPGATLPELLDADELFLTNTISGIRWIVGLGEKRFYGIKVRDIFKQFRKTLPIN